MAKLKEVLSLKNPATRRTLRIGLFFILGFVVFAVIGIQVWEYSNSTAFCTNYCHDVHPEEIAAYQDSYHARVECAECHLGRLGSLSKLGLKIGHIRQIPQTIFGWYERPLEAATMRPAAESCELCHWPPAFHGDTVREVRRFGTDQDNTEKRIYLFLKTGGGERASGLGRGIHWHVENQVEFIAADEAEQSIAWVRAVLPDGRTVEYTDVTNPLPAEEIAAADVRVMDCMDCHNQVGHPFSSPGQLIDDALAHNRLDGDLPFIKQELLSLLGADYADQEQALEAVTAWETRYREAYPDVARTRGDAVDRAVQVARESIVQLVFEEPGVTWQSFPAENGHKEFPGCFRCHDGKHVSEEGESIRLHCNVCHSVPVTVHADDRPPAVPVASLQEPDSHLAANFIADHRFQANSACVECHGEIAFGDDDSSFCANSVCHGQAWPSVELDAAFPHPVELEGEHAEVWCHECHEGVQKPEYDCTNCHEPPSGDHFVAGCERCHTPDGFELALALVEDAPQIPHSLELHEDCVACHAVDGNIEPAPSDHEGRVNDRCRLCHGVE